MKRSKPVYAAVVEANRRAQVSVLESLGRKIPEILRDSTKYLEHVREETQKRQK